MKVVGLMSGTSLDGIDAALCEIDGAPPALNAQILATVSIPYEHEFRGRLLALCSPGTIDDACRLSFELGERFAEAVKFVAQDLQSIDLIGSHGQTIWHDVDNGQVTSTLQIGSASVIAERTGITTISNFRERDIAAGGQGAPLTSYVDWLLLRHPDQWRAVQNIGGIGNVTLLPPLQDTQSSMLAFDTGPGNVLIDALVATLTDGTHSYDEDGAMAAEGTVDEAWLADLLTHPYFQLPPPRTTGRELFSTAMAADLLATGRARNLRDVDTVATVTALTAYSIADAYRRFAPHPPYEVILGGGGAHNQTIVQMLSDALPDTVIQTHEAIGLDSDFKEALVFAVLAYETWHNRVGCLPEQTGATHGTVLGQITPGDNYAALIKRSWS